MIRDFRRLAGGVPGLVLEADLDLAMSFLGAGPDP
jgi:hypothetical protein